RRALVAAARWEAPVSDARLEDSAAEGHADGECEDGWVYPAPHGVDATDCPAFYDICRCEGTPCPSCRGSGLVKLVVHIPCPHGLRDTCWCNGSHFREIDPDEVLPFKPPISRYRITAADVLEAALRLEAFDQE